MLQESGAANAPKNLKISKRAPLNCSEEQRQKLQALLARASGWIETPKGTRLRVLTLSCEQRTVAEIANELGSVTRTRVYQILGEAETRGLEAEIADLEAFAAERVRSTAKANAHVGRKGYETWEQYIGGEFFEGELYVEIATLIFAPGIRLAAFVVSRTKDIGADRPRKSKSEAEPQAKDPIPPSFREVEEILREASAGEVVAPAWTQISTFDSLCKDLFATLRQKAEEMELHPLDIYFLEDAHYRKIADLFPSVERCLIFAAGESNFCDSVVEAITDGVLFDLIRADDEDDFLQRLESAVFTLRNRVTGVGLLPHLWQLNNNVTPDADNDLIWQCDQSMADQWMVRRLAVRDFFALQGALFAPGLSLLSALPYHGRVKFKTLALQPKIEIIQSLPDRQEVQLEVRPIPEFKYTLTMACAGDPKEVVQRLRETLRTVAGERARQVLYAAEPGGDQHDSTVSPTLEEILAPFRAGGSPGAGVVLFQRHFLCPEPDLSNERIAQRIHSMEDGTCIVEADADRQEDRYLVAKFECLHDALRRAFEANRYGDAIAEIGRWQGSLSNYSEMRPGRAGSDWLVACALMNAFTDTTYCFFPDGRADPVGAMDVQRRMDYAVHQLSDRAAESETVAATLVERYRQMVAQVNAAHAGADSDGAGRALADFLVAAARTLFGAAQATEFNTLGFPYDTESTFRRLLLDLDADFLLRHLFDEDRSRLERIAAGWRDFSLKAIDHAFWPAGEFQADRAKSLCSPNVLSKVLEKLGGLGLDLEDLCAQTRTEFAAGRMRVSRWALEAGQRMVIAGEQPIFCAVQSEDDLLRSWRSFLGQRIRRVLDDPEQPKTESLEARRESIKPGHRTVNPYRDEDSDDSTEADTSGGLGSL